MRNKGEFSCIIFILLMEYALSEDKCERGICLGQFSFGHFLPRSIFTTKYEVSPYQCATECQLRRQRCKSFNYRRSALSCQLCEEDSGPGGIHLQPKAGSDHSNIETWKNIPVGHCNERNCSWTERCDSKGDPQSTCLKTECPFALLKPGVTIQPSNETAVGTKARYRCVSEDMERGSYLTTCLESTAEWSNTSFKCEYKGTIAKSGTINETAEVELTLKYTYIYQDGLIVCKTPPVKSGAINENAEVELGENYTYKCQEGLLGKENHNPTVTCLQDGNWTSTNFTCVCKSPPVKSGAINENAEVESGQNYTYRCLAGLIGKRGQEPTVTCQHDGNWTSTNFTCVCKTPINKSGTINETAEVEIGQIYTYRCQNGLIGKGDLNPIVMCLPGGDWTTTHFTCVKQNWTQDTIYPKNIHKSEVIGKITGIDLLACMQECDKEYTNCLSFFYDNHTSLCVLSSSFQRGLPEGFQFSDGLVYYTAPSTSCDLQYSNVILNGSYFCIKHHPEKKSFNEAMKACESEKAKLLVVTTKAQITDVTNFWRNLAGVEIKALEDSVYIGLNDQTAEGSWMSWKGERVYPVWRPGQPNNKKDQDCACIWWEDGGINDYSCKSTFTFLCHKSHF